MADLEKDDKRKPHRERLSGRKADKKKAKKDHQQELTAKQRNPKAFAVSNVVRAERRFRRTEDHKRKKEHIPLVDRTPLEPPPILVAVVGPPKVGKSLLIRSLIKSYSRQPLTTIKGPVTVVSGKKRRITIIECNNDVGCMVDIAKVADLVLLMIDASFGFEMEVFEFLNICQVHGMPKIMGVLTHLDMIKQTKKLQRTKKMLKHRFWKEVYPGAKLFYLSNLQHGQYLKNEVKNLARFISVMKFRPLTWQTTHPYILADRMEDTTPPEQIQLNPQTDRTVCLYGYMRGIPMHKNSFIHIAGCGDYAVENLSFLPDPCPLPEQLKKRTLVDKERIIYAPFSGVGGIVYDKDAVYVELPNHNAEAHSDDPTSELVSTLMETKETVDTKLATSKVQLFSGGMALTASEFDGVNMEQEIDNGSGDDDDLAELKGGNDSDGEDTFKATKEYSFKKIKDQNSGRERRKVMFGDVIECSDDESEHEFSEDDTTQVDKREGKSGKSSVEMPQVHLTDKERDLKEKISMALSTLKTNEVKPEEMGWSNSSSESGDDDMEVGGGVDRVPWASDNPTSDSGMDIDEMGESSEEDLPDTDFNWKNNMAEKAANEFITRQASKQDLWKMVYGPIQEEADDENEDEELGGLFKVVRSDRQKTTALKDNVDALDSSKFPVGHVRDWDDPKVIETIKDCFVTGKWKDGEDADELLKLDDLSEPEDDELFGDFEDLETGEKHIADSSAKGKVQAQRNSADVTKEQLLEKKKKLKAKFDDEYDNKEGDESYFEELKMEANKQAELNRKQFEDLDDSIRVEIEGYRAGLYVRLEIKKMPCEFIDRFDPSYPIIIGGLQPGEQNVGYVKVRLKKHRWYKKILKTKDPLIISMGWRRFQTIAVYSKQEDNMRHRMLKYTPEHVACMAHFWGPITRAATGFLALVNSFGTGEDPGFRITATGAVVDTDQSTAVTKKLKLIGTPYKIFKKTAFVKGMFNTTLEVARFEGAKIKTVSGIRGMIKKPLSTPEGSFRATFEDKILLSDIIMCRTWYRIEIPRFYAPVTSLLLPISEKNTWQGMRTLGALKREKGIQNPAQPDSMYTEIVREEKVAKPLVIPRAVEKDLPYRYKKKVKAAENKGTPFGRVLKNVVVRDDHEAKVSSLMAKLRVNYQMKKVKMKQEKRARFEELKKRKEKEALKHQKKNKEMKKAVYRTMSKLEAAAAKRSKK
uniref:Bms1-type G domain-containing protein n=1 Tax=Lygus hesperus TaxID=30085 RepID=A0A0A9YDD7_LYGHE